MKLLALTPPGFAPLAQLAGDPDVEIVAGNDAAVLRRRLGGTDAVLLAPRYGSRISDLWLELRGVRWIHALGAGVETLPFDLLRRSEIVVTNSRGLYADALAEFALAAMLWFAKDLRRLVVNQQARLWAPFLVERLEGRTVGIVGYGGIGQAVGRRATALGMHVVPVRRRRETGDATLDEAVRRADYLVLSAPLTNATRGLMSRERLAAMRPDAVLVNIGRGALVDQSALFDLLRARRIRGAALDVFEIEPLPADDPLWQLDNVLLSPHSADQTADSHERAMAFFVENLARFRRGESLENVVDKGEGY